MIWEDFITGLTASFGFDSIYTTAMLLSIIFIIVAVFIAALASKGHGPATMLMGFFSLIFFIVLGWMPVWTMLLLVLMIAVGFSGKIRDWLSGGK